MLTWPILFSKELKVVLAYKAKLVIYFALCYRSFLKLACNLQRNTVIMTDLDKLEYFKVLTKVFDDQLFLGGLCFCFDPKRGTSGDASIMRHLRWTGQTFTFCLRKGIVSIGKKLKIYNLGIFLTGLVYRVKLLKRVTYL